jgi:hypothetical protein
VTRDPYRSEHPNHTRDEPSSEDASDDRSAESDRYRFIRDIGEGALYLRLERGSGGENPSYEVSAHHVRKKHGRPQPCDLP